MKYVLLVLSHWDINYDFGDFLMETGGFVPYMRGYICYNMSLFDLINTTVMVEAMKAMVKSTVTAIVRLCNSHG
jgi:hypothetical protein